MEAIQKIMKYINKCIVKQDSPDWVKVIKMVESLKIDEDLKSKLIPSGDNPTKYNRLLLDTGEEFLEREKVRKLQSKLVNEDSDTTLIKDFEQFENYIYDIVKTPHHSTNKGKAQTTKNKVYIGYIENLYGKDTRAAHEDLFSEGKVFLWEALKKYGKRPEKAKNFESRQRKNTSGISSKSTFTFGHIRNRYTNVGRSCITSKRSGEGEDNRPIEVEFNLDYHNRVDDSIPDMTFSKKEMTPKHWKNVQKEFGLDKSAKEVRISAGQIIIE